VVEWARSSEVGRHIGKKAGRLYCYKVIGEEARRFGRF
jgi:hypothetical protein